MPNDNRPGWGAMLPRFNIPETFGAALSYEGQLHWFLQNWDEVAEYANALEQPTVTVGRTAAPDTTNSALPYVTNSGTDINAVLDFTYPIIRTRFADPYEWDFESAYDVLTVVSDGDGNSYTSRQAVPAHTPLTDTDYWVRTGSYDASIDYLDRRADNIEHGYVRVYKTVADMQRDDWITGNMICRTLGFYSAGDGGAAWYVIGTADPNGMDVLQLAVNNSASAVICDSMCAVAFGAHPGGTEDSSAAINRALDMCGTVTLTKATYVCDLPIVVHKPYQTFDGAGAKIVTESETPFSQIKLDGRTSPAYRMNSVVKNLNVKGPGVVEGFVNLDVFMAANFTVENCVFDSAYNNLYVDSGLICTFSNCDFKNSYTAIETPASFTYSPFNNAAFYSCRFYTVDAIIYNTGANIGHGISFYSCELEYIHSTREAAVYLAPTSGRSSDVIANFHDCWIESATPAFLYFSSTQTLHDKVALFGCSYKTAGAANAIISDGGQVLEVGCSDQSTYSDTRIKVVTSYAPNQVKCIGVDRWNSASAQLVDGLTIENTDGISKIDTTQSIVVQGSGSTERTRIYSEANKLAFQNTTGYRFYATYDRPLTIMGGGSFVHLWTYGNHLYAKGGSTQPASGSDGTVIL